MSQAEHLQPATPDSSPSVELPVVPIPTVPDAMTLWTRALQGALVLTALFLLDAGTEVLLNKWLLESMGYEQVFWTNFKTGAVLFVVGFVGVSAGIARPTLSSRLAPEWKKLIRLTAVLAGLAGAYLMAGQFLDFLMWMNGQPFGKDDIVFGRDIGFYVFSLPAIWVVWTAIALPFSLGLISSALCEALSRDDRARPDGMGRFAFSLGRMSSTGVRISVGILGLVLAAGVWLSRFDLLWKDNLTSAIWTGAEYVDVEGFFSTLHYYYVTTLVTLGLTAVAVWALGQLHARAMGSASREDVSRGLGLAGRVAVGLIALDFAFAGLVSLREVVSVVPNEPVIQLPYIERHIQATREGYDLDRVEVHTLRPHRDDDPIPTAEELLASPTLRNVPLWPGWAQYLERVLDPQHADRVFLTGGDPMIYGPALDILRQQQKLRTYYDFMAVDTVRYPIDGETRIFLSAARELPLDAPQQWLQWWGQRFLLFTHGYGLAMAPVSEVDGEGSPIYASFGFPAETIHPVLKPGNEALYYGEGATQMAYSNAQGVNEFDHPIDEGRVEVTVAPADTGVLVDSWLKRFVFGWQSGVLFDIWFSDMITSETRGHYTRTPVDRAEAVAPFLYLDDNAYAIATPDSIVWMINALTSTDRYPYSAFRDLGDKSDERGLENRPEPIRNYIRDAVKVTIDAHSGAVTLYRISDDPITRTWDATYPGLLVARDQMPQVIREHMQYPAQMLHTQFDDIYKRYHMVETIEFFNMEDLWDDGDEVLGPILDEGKAITFSNEPHDWLAVTDGDGALPAASTPTQFVRSMYFTNEKAPNLRSMTMAYQDGDDYGRLIDLRVPKGLYYPSPEQADAAIDQDPDISEQISWWNRTGAQVIHGHTNALVIGNEVLYVAPLFIRSEQATLSQLKRVIVVFRGHAADGITLEQALRKAMAEAQEAQDRNRREGRIARAG
jgi:uncharacterized membrane protein (UPF0182 family)